MFISFFLILALEGTTHFPEDSGIDLDALGINRSTGLTLYQMPEGYLLNSRREGVAVLFDQKGVMKGRYDRQGMGPGEFHNQYVLSIDEEGIHFVSNNRFILSFDHELKPIDPAWSQLPGGGMLQVGHALPLSQGRMLVALNGQTHLFAILEHRDRQWLPIKKIMPEGLAAAHPQQQLRQGFHAIFNGESVFVARKGLTRNEAYYQVRVLKPTPGEDGQLVASLVLAGETFDGPEFLGVTTLINAMARTQDGFVVELLRNYHPGSQRFVRHFDYFSSEGGFRQRVLMNDRTLVPVINGQGAFVIDDRFETRYLKRL